MQECVWIVEGSHRARDILMNRASPNVAKGLHNVAKGLPGHVQKGTEKESLNGSLVHVDRTDLFPTQRDVGTLRVYR